MKKIHKGKFISFEGPEKSGKSTQAHLLMRHLQRKGYPVIFVREPGSTLLGEKIRRILLDKKHAEMTLRTEMLLYMAARAQLVEKVIRPALKKGILVLCDRFLDSTLAYQGFGCGLDIESIRCVGRLACQEIAPDLTLLLDFWQSSTNLKNHKTPDRIEMRSDIFHRRVRRGYFMLAKKEPLRIKIISVQDDVAGTQQLIREVVKKCLLKKSSAKKQPSGC